MKLMMTWPKDHAAPVIVPVEGYALEIHLLERIDHSDITAAIMCAGFPNWNDTRTKIALRRCVLDGCITATIWPERYVVAVAMAQQPKREHDPSWGELGWLAVAPEHRGRGLGRAVCAAATRALLAAGLEPMLVVNHNNLPAIKTYLKVGYVPVLRPRDVAAWTEISRRLVFRLQGLPAGAGVRP